MKVLSSNPSADKVGNLQTYKMNSGRSFQKSALHFFLYHVLKEITFHLGKPWN